MYSACLPRLAPGKYVLVDAVDQCAVEIEEEGLSSRGCIFSIKRLVRCHRLILRPFEGVMKTFGMLCAVGMSLAVLCAFADRTSSAPVATQVLFDDFSYANKTELKKNGWIVRTVPGWPGVPGATWADNNVSLLWDPDQPKTNQILRMTSATDGTPANTTQTQICHQRKYFEGTYAARVRFSDTPISGPDGDQLVQSFYTIAPLKAPMDPDYRELDWEYLPHGGWGIDGPTLYSTTWETFSPEPN